MKNLKADTIDGVIQSLDRIIEWAKANKSRLGYFAALYRKVTIRVKQGIVNNEFDDGPRMERLDVIFANRYLQAFENHMNNRETTDAWLLAFQTAEKSGYIVLQHLLLGMNAHIGLDLAISAFETAGTGELQTLKNDFNKINSILFSLVDNVQKELAQIWPAFKLLDRLSGRTDERLSDMLMKGARDQAWKSAEELAQTSNADIFDKIKDLDIETTAFAKIIMPRHLLFYLITWVIRITEIKSIRKIISILE